MYYSDPANQQARSRAQSKVMQLISLLLLFSAVALLPIAAQDQSPPATNPGQSAPDADGKAQKQEPPPEAGGPGNDVGPYAIPKKKDEPPPPPPPEKAKKIEGMPDYSIHVDVPVVNVDVLVTTKDGQFIPGLKRDNFKVLEDGIPQNVTNFNTSEAPITAVLLVEFASTSYPIMVDALNAGYAFANSLKKDDWVAVVAYDMKPAIMVDFTQDKRAVYGALNQLRIPGFAETNLFDALYDTLDRIDQIPGHKYVILVSTGIDTFSKLNFDQAMKKVKTTHDVTIFPVSVGWALRNYCETHGCTGISHGMASLGMKQIDYLQADNEMTTFARLTGGRFYQPRFQAELPEIFHSILSDIRNQYTLAYHPTNPKLDGTYRKLKIEIVGPDGSPLKVRDQKGKDVKYQIIAREGYTAKHTVD
jgi:VWFA-related protein